MKSKGFRCLGIRCAQGARSALEVAYGPCLAPGVRSQIPSRWTPPQVVAKYSVLLKAVFTPYVQSIVAPSLKPRPRALGWRQHRAISPADRSVISEGGVLSSDPVAGPAPYARLPTHPESHPTSRGHPSHPGQLPTPLEAKPDRGKTRPMKAPPPSLPGGGVFVCCHPRPGCNPISPAC